MSKCIYLHVIAGPADPAPNSIRDYQGRFELLLNGELVDVVLRSQQSAKAILQLGRGSRKLHPRYPILGPAMAGQEKTTLGRYRGLETNSSRQADLALAEGSWYAERICKVSDRAI
jgi:hypothetical protein